MLKAIHAQESHEACGRKAGEVANELESMRLGAAARTARDGFAETPAYTEFPGTVKILSQIDRGGLGPALL